MTFAKHSTGPSRWLFVLILGVALFGASEAFAQTTGKVTGIVTDAETGEPIPGVNVLLQGTQRGTTSGTDGYFSILNVPAGTYTIRATFVGYAPYRVQGVGVNVGQTSEINIAMQEETVGLDEVTVTAQAPVVDPDVTSSVQQMDAAALDRTPVVDFEDVMSQQTGVYSTGVTNYVRGGVQTEVKYKMDGTSLNSGILGDNWGRINTTAIEQVSLQTGGYNAEYGNAMSGVVNVVTRDPGVADRSLHGEIRYQMRPPGKYHWGRSMYDRSLWKYENFDRDYWARQLEDPQKRTGFADYFERWYDWDGERVPTAEELHQTYLDQLDPGDVLGNYTERAQHEGEISLWGSPIQDVSFLLTGRYKQGVNIFPQANKHNPEFNVQGKIGYHFSSGTKLTLNVLRGGYTASTYTESNWNNMASSQEARWQPNVDVRSPYQEEAYGPWGGQWMKGPQEKDVTMASLDFRHMLNQNTYYTAKVSYLRDRMTELQEYDKLTQDTDAMPWGSTWFGLAGNFRIESRQIQVNNYSDSKALTGEFDITSQITRSHQLKAGAQFQLYDLDYQHYYMEFPSGDVWHLDNVFAGRPLEGSGYIQDKMEYSGIVLNVGLRFDAFNTRMDYAPTIYDPVMFQDHNGGVNGAPSNTAQIWQAHERGKDWFAKKQNFMGAFDGNRQNKNTVSSEWKMALSPRLGVSFPITEDSKLRFSYGHFTQRPVFSKLMGFPTSWYDSAPYESVRMDQWQGWYGHPGLTYGRTIQYEVSYTQNLLDLIRLDVTGYYKDATGLTSFSHNSTYNQNGGSYASTGWGQGNFTTFSHSRNIANDGHDNIFYTNNAYKDIRGIELTAEKMFRGRWSARATFDYSFSSGGATGYAVYREAADRPHTPHSYTETKANWLSNYRIKGNLNYVTPQELGPMGVLGGITAGIYYEYFGGPQYTWYPDDYQGLRRPNNKRWFPHTKTDLTFKKRINLEGLTPKLGVQVKNLFNQKDEILPGGEDLDRWEEEGKLPTVAKSGEKDVWGFYNAMSLPPRMVFITLGLEF